MDEVSAHMDRKKTLIISVFLFVLSSIGMAAADTYIQNDITKNGIVSFEFIETIENSSVAMDARGSTGEIATGISLGLDYVYIGLYTIIICTIFARNFRKSHAA